MELPEIKEIIFNFVTNLLQGNFQQGDISQFGSQKHTCVAFFYRLFAPDLSNGN